MLARLVVAIASIFVVGLGLSAMLRGRERVGWCETLGRSWLLGTGGISLFLWLAGHVLRGPWLLAAGASVAIACGCIGLWRSAARAAGAARWTPRELLLGALIAGELSFIASWAPTVVLGWDGLLVWEFKAQVAFANGGAIPTAYLRDASRAWSHPDYPLHLPLTETWVYLWLGRVDQSWIRVLFPLFYVAATAVLGGGCARLSNRRWIGLSAAALLFFVPYIIGNSTGALAGYADFPLAACYLAAVVALFSWVQNGEGGELRIAAAFSALLPWIKQDGLILWVAFALCAGIAVARRRAWGALPVLLFPGLAMLLSWKLYGAAIGVVSDASYLPMNAANLQANAGRIGPLAARLGREFLDLNSWSLTWIGAALALSWLAVHRRAGDALFLAAAIVPPIAAYTCIYVFSSWTDYMLHVDRSLPRLLMQIAPVAVLAISLCLAPTDSPKLRETT